MIVGEYQKLYRWSGGYYATAGRLDDGVDFVNWLEDRTYNFKPHKNFQAIFTEDKLVFEIVHTMIPMPAIAPLGLGTSGSYCEILVRSGLTGKQAIEVMKKIDPTVGGKIDVVEV